jgi:MFS family permease
MVYSALLAIVSDAAAPEWRARGLGVYRCWRDLGYAIGALLAGVLADLIGSGWPIGMIGGLTFLSAWSPRRQWPRQPRRSKPASSASWRHQLNVV